MGLKQNGYRDNIGLFRFYGATIFNGANPYTLPMNYKQTGTLRNITAGEGISDDKVGIPMGNLAPSSWVMPQKPGMISARAQGLTITGAASGLLGMPGQGAASFSITFADADGQLITSGAGSASFSIATNTPALTASINGAGSASFSILGNTSLLGALADLKGQATMSFSGGGVMLPANDASPLRSASASFAFSGSLVPYAVGHMEGSTIDTSELTPGQIAATVWGSAATEFNATGTMGNKLNTASSGGVDLSALADAIWTAESAEDLAEMVEFLQKVVKNKRAITTEASGKALVVYDDDDTTPILSKPLADKDGGAIADLAAGILAQEGKSTT